MVPYARHFTFIDAVIVAHSVKNILLQIHRALTYHRLASPLHPPAICPI